MRLIDAESAMDGATLFDWYISSVMDGTPVWTEEHIDELLRDFLVIPINTPAMDEWIKCSEKKPKARTDVILQFDENMCVGFYSHGLWNVNTGNGFYTAVLPSEDQPIAWMPLPEPPKEDKEDA